MQSFLSLRSGMAMSLTQKLREMDEFLWHGLGVIEHITLRIWENPLHKHYTRHGIQHSCNVIKHLDRMTEKLMKTSEKLNKHEIFILLASAYLHDIGMQDGKSRSLTHIREHHHEISSEKIHLSVDNRKKYRTLGLEPFEEYVDYIALVSKGHRLRSTDLTSGAYKKTTFQNYSIRLPLLAALLNFADELNLDFTRVNMDELRTKRIPFKSRIEWYRHHYVEGVRIEEGAIKIHFKVPEHNYLAPIKILVLRKLLERYIDLRGILWTGGIKLVIPKKQEESISSTKWAMRPIEFRYMLKEANSQRVDFMRLQRELFSLHETEKRLTPIIPPEKEPIGGI